MDAPAPDLDKLGPQELLDVLAITSEQWGLIADKLEVIAQTAKSPTMVHVRAELTRATALRSRVRDRLVDLLNRLPR